MGWTEGSSHDLSLAILSNPTVMAVILVAILLPLLFVLDSLGQNCPSGSVRKATTSAIAWKED